jgi:hypothetical protein
MFSKRIAPEERTADICIYESVCDIFSNRRQVFSVELGPGSVQGCQHAEPAHPPTCVRFAAAILPWTPISQSKPYSDMSCRVTMNGDHVSGNTDFACLDRYAQIPQRCCISYCKAKTSGSRQKQQRTSFWRQSGASFYFLMASLLPVILSSAARRRYASERIRTDTYVLLTPFRPSDNTDMIRGAAERCAGLLMKS